MNAVGLVEQESGRAVGFFCGNCGRPQLPFSCCREQDAVALTEHHRKAEACCTHSMCRRHDFQLHDWHLCPHCIAEGPEGRSGDPAPDAAPADHRALPAVPALAAKVKRSRKAAAK